MLLHHHCRREFFLLCNCELWQLLLYIIVGCFNPFIVFISEGYRFIFPSHSLLCRHLFSVTFDMTSFLWCVEHAWWRLFISHLGNAKTRIMNWFAFGGKWLLITRPWPSFLIIFLGSMSNIIWRDYLECLLECLNTLMEDGNFDTLTWEIVGGTNDFELSTKAPNVKAENRYALLKSRFLSGGSYTWSSVGLTSINVPYILCLSHNLMSEVRVIQW